jgi:hypothetical protein
MHDGEEVTVGYGVRHGRNSIPSKDPTIYDQTWDLCVVVNLRWKGLRIGLNTVLITIYPYRLSDTLSGSCTRV